MYVKLKGDMKWRGDLRYSFGLFDNILFSQLSQKLQELQERRITWHKALLNRKHHWRV